MIFMQHFNLRDVCSIIWCKVKRTSRISSFAIYNPYNQCWLHITELVVESAATCSTFQPQVQKIYPKKISTKREIPYPSRRLQIKPKIKNKILYPRIIAD